MAGTEKNGKLFEKINEVAADYARSHDLSKREELISLVLGSIIDETEVQRNKRLRLHTDLKYSDDYAWIFGVCAPRDLIISIFEESIGEKINKNGKLSKSYFNPDKGAKYTTFFINLLKRRCKNDEYKNYDEPLSLDACANDSDDDEIRTVHIDEPCVDFDDLFDYKNHTIVITSEFFTELLKSEKAISTTKGLYSLLLINFTRYTDKYSKSLDKLSDIIFAPTDKMYIEKMTTCPKHCRKLYELYRSELSKYVFDNKLDGPSFNDSDVRILIDKSISVFYGIKQATLSYQKEKLLNQLRQRLESNY